MLSKLGVGGVPFLPASRLARARISPVRGSMTMAMPPLAWEATICSPSTRSVSYCMAWSMVSTGCRPARGAGAGGCRRRCRCRRCPSPPAARPGWPVSCCVVLELEAGQAHVVAADLAQDGRGQRARRQEAGGLVLEEHAGQVEGPRRRWRRRPPPCGPGRRTRCPRVSRPWSSSASRCRTGARARAAAAGSVTSDGSAHTVWRLREMASSARCGRGSSPGRRAGPGTRGAGTRRTRRSARPTRPARRPAARRGRRRPRPWRPGAPPDGGEGR